MSDFAGAAEVIGGAAVFLLLLARQVRTGTRDAWRDVAESQKERGDALAEKVEALVNEVRSLRVENEALRGEVALLRAENQDLRAHIDSLIGGARADS